MMFKATRFLQLFLGNTYYIYSLTIIQFNVKFKFKKVGFALLYSAGYNMVTALMDALLSLN